MEWSGAEGREEWWVGWEGGREEWWVSWERGMVGGLGGRERGMVGGLGGREGGMVGGLGGRGSIEQWMMWGLYTEVTVFSEPGSDEGRVALEGAVEMGSSCVWVCCVAG